jgi:hypothetical protein
MMKYDDLKTVQGLHKWGMPQTPLEKTKCGGGLQNW